MGRHLVARLQKDDIDCKIVGRDLVISENTDLMINLVGGFYPPFEKQVESNVTVLQKICEQAVSLGIEKIIHISATAATTDTTYGLSKKLSEEVCRFYHEHFGLKFIILRPPNVY